MILSLYQKTPFAPSAIIERLNKRKLLDSPYEKSEIFYQMKKFVDNDIAPQISILSEPDQVKAIQAVLHTISKSMKDKHKLIWIQIFAIHTFFKYALLNCHQKKLIIETLLQEISQIKSKMLNKKSNEPENLITRSLSKIKKTLNSRSLQKMFGVQNVQESKSTDKLQELQKTIVLQYLMYLEKFLHDWFELEKFVSPQNNPEKLRQKILMTQESKTNLIWKILNLFKKIQKINKDHVRIHQIFKDYSTYFCSMMNYISEDMEMLYNPIVSEIRTRINAVNWVEIMKSLDKREKTRDEALISNDQILEIHSIVEELGNANEVILYVLYGSFHHKFMYNKKKPSNFVSINEKQFDSIYSAARKIIDERNKFQQQKVKLQETNRLKQSLAENIVVSIETMEDSNEAKTEREEEESKRLMGGQKMKAVNYKSEKLKEMLKQTAKKQ